MNVQELLVRYGTPFATALLMLGCSGDPASEGSTPGGAEEGAAAADSTNSLEEATGSSKPMSSRDCFDRGDCLVFVCSASLVRGGPLFYAEDSDLGRAMQYAVDTCERQMHDTCFQKGCRTYRRRY